MLALAWIQLAAALASAAAAWLLWQARSHTAAEAVDLAASFTFGLDQIPLFSDQVFSQGADRPGALDVRVRPESGE